MPPRTRTDGSPDTLSVPWQSDRGCRPVGIGIERQRSPGTPDHPVNDPQSEPLPVFQRCLLVSFSNGQFLFRYPRAVVGDGYNRFVVVARESHLHRGFRSGVVFRGVLDEVGECHLYRRQRFDGTRTRCADIEDNRRIRLPVSLSHPLHRRCEVNRRRVLVAIYELLDDTGFRTE